MSDLLQQCSKQNDFLSCIYKAQEQMYLWENVVENEKETLTTQIDELFIRSDKELFALMHLIAAPIIEQEVQVNMEDELARS